MGACLSDLLMGLGNYIQRGKYRVQQRDPKVILRGQLICFCVVFPKNNGVKSESVKGWAADLV